MSKKLQHNKGAIKKERPPDAPGAGINPTGDKVRVWVAEDHASFRELLSSYISDMEGMKLAGTSNTAEPALDAARRGEVDLVVMDLMIPERGGLEIVADIRKENLPVKVMICSAVTTVYSVNAAVQMNVEGYVEKTCPLEEFKQAFATIAAGGRHYCDRAKTMLKTIEAEKQATGKKWKNKEEFEFLRLFSLGLPVKEAAVEMRISEPAAYRLKKAIMEREGIKSEVELIYYAIRIGVANPHDKTGG